MTLVSLELFFLVCLVSPSHAQNAQIIVHAVNPENIVIGSLHSLNVQDFQPFVRIFHNGNLVTTQLAYNYNDPIIVTPGIHTITVTFNGMSQEKTVNINPGEIRKLKFVFERVNMNIGEIIDNQNIWA
jgi:hypothetical protein